MDRHTHGPNGEYIALDSDVAETAEVAEAATDVAETTAAADVEVAEIEAERDVELAKIGVEREQVYSDSRVAELEGRIRGMEEVLERIAPPEPEPVDSAPVVVEAPPEPEVEPETAPAPSPEPDGEPKKKSKGFWGPYQ